MTRVSAGRYTLELPPNGVALLYEADGAGIDHQLPGGIGCFDALVQFAGEVVRLSAMCDVLIKDRDKLNWLDSLHQAANSVLAGQSQWNLTFSLLAGEPVRQAIDRMIRQANGTPEGAQVSARSSSGQKGLDKLAHSSRDSE
jgi:hypothetical protein